MPPKKRASPDSGEQSSQSKNVQTSNKKNKSDNASPMPQPRSKRWTAICVSANIDADFASFVVKEPEKAYSYICFCPSHQRRDSDGEGPALFKEDQESLEEERNTKYKCDNGKTCLCRKPAVDHPEHIWTITWAGMLKLSNFIAHADIRCPDLFDLHVYNDFHGYGLVEVAQNSIIDFVEAEGDWKEQWAISEAIAHYMMDDGFGPLTGIDDGECANATLCVLGGMFLMMLSTLESQELLSPNSEIKNLGTIMASYIDAINTFRDYGIFEDTDDPKDKILKFHNTDEYILAYAEKHDIEIRGPPKIKDHIDDMEEVKIPNKTGKDPWAWNAALKEYEKRYGHSKKPKIGGNEFDITAMSSAERKKSSFSKKDPLGKKELNAIKEGLVMQLA